PSQHEIGERLKVDELLERRVESLSSLLLIQTAIGQDREQTCGVALHETLGVWIARAGIRGPEALDADLRMTGGEWNEPARRSDQGGKPHAQGSPVQPRRGVRGAEGSRSGATGPRPRFQERTRLRLLRQPRIAF